MSESPDPGIALKQIRHSLGLSLDEVSEKTSVSKAMLSKIERHQTTPTITTLWKIASGLKVPLSSFLEVPFLLKEGMDNATPLMIDEEGKMRAYPVFAYDPLRSTETYRIEFDPGVQHSSLPHQHGVVEEVFVLQGEITISCNKEKILLKQNQAIRFLADQLHTYSTDQKPAEVYNTIYYPGTSSL